MGDVPLRLSLELMLLSSWYKPSMNNGSHSHYFGGLVNGMEFCFLLGVAVATNQLKLPDPIYYAEYD